MVHSTLAVAAFVAAAGVSAGPIDLARRFLVTEIDVVTVTEYVTAGFVIPTAVATADGGYTDNSANGNYYYGGPGGHHGHGGYSVSVDYSVGVSVDASVETPAATSVAEATPYTTAVAVVSTYVPEVAATTEAAAAPVTTSAANVEVASTTAAVAAATATDYDSVVLYQHNIHRANHSATDLVWNSTLASIALEIAQTCIYEHNV